MCEITNGLTKDQVMKATYYSKYKQPYKTREIKCYPSRNGGNYATYWYANEVLIVYRGMGYYGTDINDITRSVLIVPFA